MRPIRTPTVKDLTQDNFGLVICYVLPGFVALWGVRSVFPDVNLLLGISQGTAPTVGGFLYGTLAATATGLVLSIVRWAVLDRIYHHTGIPEPDWDFRRLPANLVAFESHVRDHFNYHKCFGNLLIAIVLAYSLHLASDSSWPGQSGWGHLVVLLLLVVLVIGSRDALRKYYARTAALLASRPARPPPRHASKTTVQRGSAPLSEV